MSERTMGPATVGGYEGNGDKALDATAGDFIEPDNVTLARVGEGDRDALALLYSRYQRPLFGYLCRLARDRAVAEEILQDTLLAVWQGAGSFEGRSTVRAWLFGIARRQAHNRLRRKSLTFVPLDPVAVLAADGQPSPEDMVIARSEQARISAALGELPDFHRDALVLFFLADFSYTDIAVVLDVPVGTVKSRLNHGKRALRVLLLNDDPSEVAP